MALLDEDICYRALRTRDARFDGRSDKITSPALVVIQAERIVAASSGAAVP